MSGSFKCCNLFANSYILLVWHVVTGRSAAFITVWDELAEAAGSTPPSMSTKSKARKWRRARRRQKQRQEKVKVSKSKSGKKRVLQMVVSLSKATLSSCCFPQPYFLYILIPAYILYAVYILLAPTGALVVAPLSFFHITSSRSSKSLYNLLTLLKNLEHLCLYI